jgi:hypothetical protein
MDRKHNNLKSHLNNFLINLKEEFFGSNARNLDGIPEDYQSLANHMAGQMSQKYGMMPVYDRDELLAGEKYGFIRFNCPDGRSLSFVFARRYGDSFNYEWHEFLSEAASEIKEVSKLSEYVKGDLTKNGDWLLDWLDL